MCFFLMCFFFANRGLGEEGQLGHGDRKSKLEPTLVKVKYFYLWDKIFLPNWDIYIYVYM